MKLLPCLALAVALLAAGGAWAQEPDLSAQRERLKAERATVEARFAEEQRACRAKFGVTDCMRGITRERNATLADLRRQENALNDAMRLRREERRQREMAEREANKQREEQVRREKAALEYKDREERAAALEKKRAAEAARPRPPVIEKAPKGAPSPQGTPRPSVLPEKSSGPTPEEAVKNRQAYERRLQEAEAHKAEVRARIAKRSKPAASALPPPATPASGS
jgi:colicin import membrane protein